MRIEDLGKVAATFIDTAAQQSVRMAPRDEARVLAPNYAPEADNTWEAYLIGYQRMSDEELLSVQEVQLFASIDSIISRPDVRATCQVCGEEIINEREVVRGRSVLCKHCAGQSYYRIT
jgi:formylmethanofuran dehydrogenase subunit E